MRLRSAYNFSSKAGVVGVHAILCSAVVGGNATVPIAEGYSERQQRQPNKCSHHSLEALCQGRDAVLRAAQLHDGWAGEK